MLIEERAVIQSDGEPCKRIFSDERLQLIIWDGDAGGPTHFQLAYKVSAKSRVVEGRGDRLYHYLLDSGPGEYTQVDRSAVLIPTGTLDRELVASLFEAASAELPGEIQATVLDALRSKGVS